MSYCLLDGELEQLCCAVRTGIVSDVQTLLDTGANIDAADQRNGETALHTAIHREHDDMVQLLLSRGANPNVQNKNGQTPLHLAASYGYNNGVSMLLDAHADISLTTQFSAMTALHFASKNGHAWIVEYLLDNDADVMALDLINKNAEFYAATREIKRLFQKDSNSSMGETDGTESASQDQDDSSGEDDNDDGDDSSSTSSGKKRKSRKSSKDLPRLPLTHKMEFSEKHKKKMRISVFDRLTRSKSKIERKIEKM